MEQKKILVLGAGGFIGTHLVNRLNTDKRNQYAVQAVGENVIKFNGLTNVSVLQGFIDKELLDKCDRPDIIYHVAGGASVAASFSNSCLDFNKTVLSFNPLLNKIRTEWPLAKLIYISSAAVYGGNASNSTSVETKIRPISPYGLHKKIVEDLIQFSSDFYNINAVIIRPFSIYGPGLKKQLFWDVLNKAELGDFDYFGTGLEKRDWIYISDFIDLLISLYSKGEKSNSECLKIINAGSGKGIENVKIIKQLLSIAGYSTQPHFLEKNRTGDPCNLVSCPSEQEKLGSFYKTPINIGLAEYVRWYKEVK